MGNQVGICVRCGIQHDAADQDCPNGRSATGMTGDTTLVGISGHARVSAVNQGMSRLARELRKAFTRPPGYRSAATWFVAGMFKDRRAIIGAFAVTWFNLPIAVFGGALGLVLGGIHGVLGSLSPLTEVIHSNIPILSNALKTATPQVSGILGLVEGSLSGLLYGFLAGLLVPWNALAPDFTAGLGLFLGQIMVGTVCGVLYTVGGVAVESQRLKVHGARRPSRRERKLLEPIMWECARRMGMGSIPTLLIDDSRDPNAYAGAHHIVINRGLLDEFNYEREPLAGVIAHELTHWREGDPLSSLFTAGVALPLFVVFNFSRFMLNSSNRYVILIPFLILAWPLLFCIRFVYMPMQAAGSRAAEFRADQGSVRAGHTDGARQVLARFRETFDSARNGWERSVCATHPPNELRLEAIEEDGKRYPLPDVDGPAIPLPVTVVNRLTQD